MASKPMGYFVVIKTSVEFCKVKSSELLSIDKKQAKYFSIKFERH